MRACMCVRAYTRVLQWACGCAPGTGWGDAPGIFFSYEDPTVTSGELLHNQWELFIRPRDH